MFLKTFFRTSVTSLAFLSAAATASEDTLLNLGGSFPADRTCILEVFKKNTGQDNQRIFKNDENMVEVSGFTGDNGDHLIGLVVELDGGFVQALYSGVNTNIASADHSIKGNIQVTGDAPEQLSEAVERLIKVDSALRACNFNS
jgi:hypothetical protein